jgi:hypothetical protein
MEMKLAIRHIQDAGDIARERIVLQAKEDVDIGDFAVFAAKKYSKGGAAGGNVPYAYWLPDKHVKAGDFVVLYTKAGTTSEKIGDTGKTSYFYYWGYTKPKWTSDVTPVLVLTSMWETLKEDGVNRA